MESETKKLTKKEKRELKKQEKMVEVKKTERSKSVAKIIRWAIGIGLIVWGLSYVWNFINTPTGSNLPLPEASEVTDTDHAKVASDSGKILIEYSDFQCPACKQYHPIVEKLLGEHGTKLTFVTRHFPLAQHKNAPLAARASEAAHKQGKFWEMHAMLFDRQDDWAEKGNAADIFADYAKELGLNVEQFKTDIDSQEVKDRVNADYASGVKNGVNSTPTFFYNGTKIENAKSYEDFVSKLELAE